MRRAWLNARLRIGVGPSSKKGGETGTRKLMGELRVQESNELPKCQEESARQFASVETLDADLTPRTRRRNRTMPPMSSPSAWIAADGRGDCFAVRDARRCRVIFGVLIVIVLR